MPFQDNYSARRVYWASQETTSDLEPSNANTAGSFDLATDGILVCGRKTRGETLLWTTVDLWAMTYIGGSLVYSFRQAGNSCGIVGPKAAIVVDDLAFWMGYGSFHMYDGTVKTIPCEVSDYVFGDFSQANSYKAWAISNPRYGEVTWHYPSASASECDRYVTLNRQEDYWVFGELERVAGVTRRAGAVVPVPVMVDEDGNLYDHETGDDHGDSTPHVESGPVEIGDGNHIMRVQRIVPDDKTMGDVNISIYTSMYPNADETLNGPYTLANPTSVRLTARQVRIRIEEEVAAAWRVGVPRFGVRPVGRR